MRRWRVVIDIRDMASIHRDLLDGYLGHLEPIAEPYDNESGVRVILTVPAADEARARTDAAEAVERLVGAPVRVTHVVDLDPSA